MPAPSTCRPRTVTVARACTDDVRPVERLRYWQAHTAAQLIGVRCSAFAAEGLVARQHNFDLGDVRITEIAGNEHVVERTEPLLRRHPKNAVFATLLLEGETFFFQAGRCMPVRAGDLIIYGTGTPYLYGVTRPMRQVQVDITAELLPRLTTPILVDGSLRAGRLLTQPLRRELMQFIQVPHADLATAAGQRIASLLAVLVQGHAGSAAADLRLLRAESFIAEHFADPDLDADTVARSLAMSARHLSRLFEPHGCTATQWIWQTRLAVARRTLASDVRAASIGAVALQCGFATQAHFARLFKAATGMTPSEYRDARAVRRDGAGPPTRIDIGRASTPARTTGRS
jgi:AraC-like DNA-binding protein